MFYFNIERKYCQSIKYSVRPPRHCVKHYVSLLVAFVGKQIQLYQRLGSARTYDQTVSVNHIYNQHVAPAEILVFGNAQIRFGRYRNSVYIVFYCREIGRASCRERV